MTLLEWLYDPTPITAEWLVEAGGEYDGTCGTSYEFGDDTMLDEGDGLWRVQTTYDDRGNCYVRTRGEFRRAAELLGIATKEVRPEDDRLALCVAVALKSGGLLGMEAAKILGICRCDVQKIVDDAVEVAMDAWEKLKTKGGE